MNNNRSHRLKRSVPLDIADEEGYDENMPNTEIEECAVDTRSNVSQGMTSRYDPDAIDIGSTMKTIEDDYFRRTATTSKCTKILHINAWVLNKIYYTLMLFSFSILAITELVTQINTTVNLNKSITNTTVIMFIISIVFGLLELIRLNSLSYVIQRKYFSRVVFLEDDSVGPTAAMGFLYCIILFVSLANLGQIQDNCIKYKHDCSTMWKIWLKIHFQDADGEHGNRTLVGSE